VYQDTAEDISVAVSINGYLAEYCTVLEVNELKEKETFRHYVTFLYKHTVFLLACFPKMKVGVSNHQSVCLYVSVCVSSTNNF
jgi:hypothetical protein